ncbi:MAG: hypothetical protein ABI721_04675 [Candidatus Dojkabacteria bacterium]
MDTIQIILIVVITLLFLFFIFYRKVIHVAFVFITIIFFFSLISTIAAIFMPQLFQTGTEFLVKDTAFAVQLKNFDGTITEIGKLPTGVLNNIQNFFNQNNNSTSEFKSDLYNQFVIFVAGVLRIGVLVLGLFLMAISIYIRYSYSGLNESIKLKHRVDELENQLQMLQSKVSQ